jgi:hypothetical protein
MANDRGSSWRFRYHCAEISTDLARLQYRGDEPVSRRDRPDRCAQRARRALGRSGRLVHVDGPRRAANITIIALSPKSPELNPVKTSGSSCGTTGSPIASSNPMTISSTTVARLGTSLLISPGGSCPSDCANGRTSSDHWHLVLGII